MVCVIVTDLDDVGEIQDVGQRDVLDEESANGRGRRNSLMTVRGGATRGVDRRSKRTRIRHYTKSL